MGDAADDLEFQEIKHMEARNQMAYQRNKPADDKYLRLTGLWPAKHNQSLFTGRMRVEDIEQLLARCEECLQAQVPLVFGLWENSKKAGPRDPDFNLQCFVGDNEETPAARRAGRSAPAPVPEDDEPQVDPAPARSRRSAPAPAPAPARGSRSSKPTSNW